ncbi:hypothetical protein TrVE_jg12819 [Triparma verrucosa]|uniref:Uncharacterized protein n=1 Tax=Triparma verrucosa TaxID=1606542 RepID=A0A9W7F965_9STRA|nr:hypothetical protein TrVE_jg12819 [Triparma verrucosa]
MPLRSPPPTLKLIAFDLDGTLWSPDMYMLWSGGSPFTKITSTLLKDTLGKDVRLLGCTGEVLDLCSSSDVVVAWVRILSQQFVFVYW